MLGRLFGKKNNDDDQEYEDEGYQEPSSGEQVVSALMEDRAWERRLSRSALLVSFLSLVACCFSILIAIIAISTEREPPIIGIESETGRVTEIVPLDEPMLSNSAITSWAAETVGDTFSISFLDWRDSLVEVRSEYTRDAFNQVFESMQDAGMVDYVRENRLNAHMNLREAGIVTSEGIVRGAHTWVIELPIIITYESSEGTERTQELLATVRARRVSPAEHPRGVMIEQLVLE